MSNYARTGGILSIISGIFSIFPILFIFLMAVVCFFLPTTKDAAKIPQEIFWIMGIVFCVMAVVFMLLGALAITGGIFATRGKHWGWALAGAIVSEWLMYPCGVAAVIMISLSKNEFKPGLSDKGMEESPIDSANLPAVTSEPGKARTAGILTIIAGVLGILNLGMCCIYITLLTLLSKSGGIFQNVYSTEYLNFQYFFYFAWGIVSVIFGILALIGGIMALRKKHWKWALTGSIAGIMAFWPCGIASTIFLSLAKEEFNKPPVLPG